MRTSAGRVITVAISQRSSRSPSGRLIMFLDMGARLIHQPLVIDAGRTGGLAVEAGEAAVDVIAPVSAVGAPPFSSMFFISTMRPRGLSRSSPSST